MCRMHKLALCTIVSFALLHTGGARAKGHPPSAISIASCDDGLDIIGTFDAAGMLTRVEGKLGARGFSGRPSELQASESVFDLEIDEASFAKWGAPAPRGLSIYLMMDGRAPASVVLADGKSYLQRFAACRVDVARFTTASKRLFEDSEPPGCDDKTLADHYLPPHASQLPTEAKAQRAALVQLCKEHQLTLAAQERFTAALIDAFAGVARAAKAPADLARVQSVREDATARLSSCSAAAASASGHAPQPGLAGLLAEETSQQHCYAQVAAVLGMANSKQ